MKLRKFALISLLTLISLPLNAFNLSIYPSSPVEGDPVLLSVSGVKTCPEGEIFGKKLRFRKYKDRWIAIFGIDLMRKPGIYNLALIVKEKGKLKKKIVKLPVGKRIFALQKLTLSKRYDELSKSDLERIERENREIRALWSLNTPVKWHGKFIHPLGRKFEGIHGHRFGARRIINGIPRKPHSGADYPAPEGTPVYAPNDGVVVLTGNHFFAGNSIYIDHGGGLISMYFHLSKILVHKGEHVRKGQKIGEVGATGRVTGPHLHFGVYWLGNRIDPDKLLSLPVPGE